METLCRSIGGFRSCYRVIGSLDFFVGRRNFQAQPREGFFGFFLPVGAAKTLRGNGVPVAGFACVFRFFFEGAQFPRDHRVVRAIKKLGKFRGCVSAVFGLAYPGLNLSPVSHVGVL